MWRLVLGWLERRDLAQLVLVGRALAYDGCLQGHLLNDAMGSRWLHATQVAMVDPRWRRWAPAACVAQCNREISAPTWDKASAWPALPGRLATLTVLHGGPVLSRGVLLPASLTALALTPTFDDPIDLGVLTTGRLASLTFHNGYFDQTIDPGVLPASLTSLDLGWAFNQRLDPGVLPACLTSLTLGAQFDRPLAPGALPARLTSLVFGFHFDQPLDPGVLPASLTLLTLSGRFDRPFVTGGLPHGLQTLRVGGHFDQPLEPGTLSASLVSLELTGSFNRRLVPGVLPADLKSLRLPTGFDRPIEAGVLPASLTSLRLGRSYHRPIALPVGVTLHRD